MTTNDPHPRGERRVGTCAFIECTEDATHDKRIVRLTDPSSRIMVRVCDMHAEALREGGTVLVEFKQG